ncbi:hypothetical protein JK363_19670 [Streptomyces sp. 205]|uniref:Integral membrane protein n=1 Tax=Streptomyces coffeae TaxID=621382 RepID=A0ABS1NFY2_9ACTN|nr:hypothetical protein [Streptomyces coffeae]
MSMSQMPTPRSQGPHRRGRHTGSVPAGALGVPGSRRAARRPRARARPGSGQARHLRLYAIGAAVVLSLVVANNVGAFTKTWAFLDFGAGVLALVSLTSAVLWGLAATDQLVLHTNHRLIAQGVHRAAAVGGLCFLALHVWVKVAESHTSAATIVVPFADANQPVLIGLGTIAGYLFTMAAVTGAVRSAFASTGKSRWRYRWWRALHVAAYPAWCAALIHGLKAGRPAKDWATAGYVMALAGVAVALWIRLASRRAQGERTDGIEVRNPPARGRQESRTGRAAPSVPRPRSAEPDRRDTEPLGASRGWGR